MSEDTGKKKRKRREREGGEEKRGGLALWQIGLLVGAVVVMGVGIALGVMAGGGGEASGAAGGAGGGVDPSGLVRGLVPVEGGGGQTGAVAAEGGTNWSPVVFRLGFSAFAGFAIGYALRSFMRFSLFALGFFFLLLLGLEYAQIIEVRWANLEDRYDDATTWIGSQTRGFTAFVSGQLPSAGLAIAGLVAGVKRR